MTFRLSAFLLSLAAVPAFAQTYDAALDFSPTVNAGTWTYGSKPGGLGAFTRFTDQNAGPALTGAGSGGDLRGWNGNEAPVPSLGPSYPFVLKNVGTTTHVVSGNAGTPSGYTVPTGTLFLHAGPQGSATIRFTAPTAGRYAVAGSFLRIQTSPTTFSQRVRIDSASANLYSTVLSGNGDSGAFALPTVTLAGGETLDFSVVSDPEFNGGSMNLNATLAYSPVPEPATILGLSLGGLALLRHRRAA